MRYGDLVIGSIDKSYLDKLSDRYNVDYYDCDIYIDENISSAKLTNQLFNYVLSSAVNNLDISDDNKEYLQSKIYCNCSDSRFNISSEDVDNMIDGSDDEKQIIKDFLNL